MNSKKLLNIILLMVLVSSVYLLSGCSKNEDPITPTNNVTDVNVNGSITPTSRTTASGNMFVTDQNGNPLSIDAGNVSATLIWTTDAAGDSAGGTVTLQNSSQTNLDIAAGITMDYSGSMGQTQIQCMENAVVAYINAMGSTDISEIIKFGSSVSVVQGFTNNKTLLSTAVTNPSPVSGSTALYQSIYKGTQDVSLQNSATYLRSVIAFTDGGENASTVSRSQMITEALTNGIPVFTVTLTNSPTGSAAVDMKNIADTTGGFGFVADPDSCQSLTNIYNQINNQFNNSYTISIIWPNSIPGSGTVVIARITVNYNGIIKSFTKSYQLP